MSDGDVRMEQAAGLAAQAAAVAASLKAGSWESVQGLALSSIALSFAELVRGRGVIEDEA